MVFWTVYHGVRKVQHGVKKAPHPQGSSRKFHHPPILDSPDRPTDRPADRRTDGRATPDFQSKGENLKSGVQQFAVDDATFFRDILIYISESLVCTRVLPAPAEYNPKRLRQTTLVAIKIALYGRLQGVWSRVNITKSCSFAVILVELNCFNNKSYVVGWELPHCKKYSATGWRCHACHMEVRVV